MKEKDIIKLIKEGCSDDRIYHLFLLKRTGAVEPRYAYWKHQEDVLEDYVSAFSGLGYPIICRQDNVEIEAWNGKRIDTTVKFDTGRPGLTLTVTWSCRPQNKRNQWLFTITLSDDNYKDIRLEFGYKHLDATRAISSVVSEWDDIQDGWSSILELTRKLRKKISVGNSTIDAILHHYLSMNPLPYSIVKEKGDTHLKLKLSYRRYIEFKLSPTMDMTKLTEIARMVNAVEEAMKSVGTINLTVRNYGNNIVWEEPERNFSDED